MIKIRYFAKYREWLGTAADSWDCASASLTDLLSHIREKNPNALKMLEDSRLIIAVNQTVVQDTGLMLKAGDEVAFYPPVTGG